jgi:hypothetical protein
MVAETSRVLACSSNKVPICPGRMSSGGANSTGALGVRIEDRHGFVVARRIAHHLIDR